ncbi:MAG: electron transfer flavoprotein subunit beta/FixA family protein [Clostridiales bacterium]|jgi:electron transfer flavoprotein beta subunit|nr:electron transfer flavoprotein subunit beta/FixA family protein [Clostridiales bacterium]
MKIAVCVKQVPSGDRPLDPRTGALIRAAGENVINPWDVYAVSAALQTARILKGTLTAISMGPPQAEETLRTAAAMGADSAVLVCGKEFGGADVYATAFTLARAIEKLGEFAIVFCGQQSTDGDTAQLPFSLAVQLGIPAVGWVKRIEKVSPGEMTVLQELGSGTQRLTFPFPAVIAAGMETCQPIPPSLKGRLKARGLAIQTLGPADLPCKGPYGLNASPTRVVKIERVHEQAKSQPLFLDPSAAARKIAEEMGVSANVLTSSS